MEWYDAAPFIVIVCIIGLVYVAWRDWTSKRERDKAIEVFALKNGFEFRADGLSGLGRDALMSFGSTSKDHRFVSDICNFYPFNNGNFKGITNLMMAQRGAASFFAFDYHAGEGSENEERVYGVHILRVGFLFPMIRLSPQNAMHWFEGSADIDLESEEFNEQFFVTADDKKGLYDLLHPRAMDYLMQLPPRDWQFGGMYMVVTSPVVINSGNIMRIMKEMEGFVDLIPAYMKQERGFEPKWTKPLD